MMLPLCCFAFAFAAYLFIDAAPLSLMLPFDAIISYADAD